MNEHSKKILERERGSFPSFLLQIKNRKHTGSSTTFVSLFEKNVKSLGIVQFISFQFLWIALYIHFFKKIGKTRIAIS